MILMPDDATAVVDPFTEEVTVNLRCNIVEPSTMQGERDPGQWLFALKSI